MDKKNTMLLTVIAVATLLVAVVGATFAYFSISGTNSSESTVVTATSGGIGTVVLQSEESALKIHLTAADMAQPASTVGYYAVDGTSFNPETKRWNATATDYNILKVKATNEDATATYSCNGTVKAVLATDASNNATLNSLVAEDGELVLTGINGTTLADGTISLKDLYDAGTTGVTKTFSNAALVSSAAGTETSIVKAHVLVNNTTAE
jgi:hypothetical protein